MTHLSMDQLLACREPASEPGTEAARVHLRDCALCQDELARLEQRVARLRALPPLVLARDQWPAVQARTAAARRRRWTQRAGWGALAAAASVALVVGVQSRRVGPTDAEELRTASSGAIVTDLDLMKARSQTLEAALEAYDVESRALDGRTAALADALQERIARLDVQLQTVQLEDADRGPAARDAWLLKLWEERVGLLDALVDVRVTRASNIGL